MTCKVCVFVVVVVYFFYFFLSFKTMSSQNIKYISFIPASENDHSNFRIYTLNLPTGSLAVIERGVYKSSLFIFHRELYSILNDLYLTS